MIQATSFYRLSLLAIALVAFSVLVPVKLNAASEVVSLLGFDAERIQQTYPLSGADAAGEMAKLLYRLNRIASDKLYEIAKSDSQNDTTSIGDAIIVEGQIESIEQVAVPDKLIEFLEIKRYLRLQIKVHGEGDADQSIEVFTTRLPRDAAAGDRIRGVGVLLADSAAAVAAAPPQWFPAAAKNVGWKLLSQQGVDIGSLSSVAARNRKPLSGDDTAIFYDMLAAAAAIAAANDVPTPNPKQIDAVALLKDPVAYTGEWIRLEVETLQITRIAVTEPARREQLGSDHYYQIDAIGRLGNVVVEIAPAKDSGGETATFENRYPISLVAKTLPPWLIERIDRQSGSAAVVTPLAIPVTIDGFFFRLWSYTSEYMQQFGGGDQFGPLLMVADITSREPFDADVVGVHRIGWVAAGAMAVAIIGLLRWSYIVARRDREIAQRRQQREAEQLELPDKIL